MHPPRGTKRGISADDGGHRTPAPAGRFWRNREPDHHARRTAARPDGRPTPRLRGCARRPATRLPDRRHARRLAAGVLAPAMVARPDGHHHMPAPGEARAVLARTLRDPEPEGRRHAADVPAELAVPSLRCRQLPRPRPLDVAAT